MLSWKDLEPEFERLLEQPLAAEDVAGWLANWTRLSDLISEAYARLSVAVTQDTRDSEAERRYHAFLDGAYRKAQTAGQSLKEKLLASGLQPAGFANPLRRMRAEAAIFREENLPLMAEERKLGSQYNKTVSAQTVVWEGQELTLPQLALHLETPDRRVRERIWRLAKERTLQDRAAINDLWAQVVNLRLRLAANACQPDYRAYRWLQMTRLDYSPEDCARFVEAVEAAAVPAATRMYARQRLRLGVESVRPWDLQEDLFPTPLPPLPAYGTADDLARGVEAVFCRLDPQFGAYFAALRAEGLLDLESRVGKAPGAYCNYFPVTGRPFLFMNAAGLAGDVRTLLHESGHAFHNFERARLPYAQQRPPGLEFSEVASMAMELLAAPHLTTVEGAFYSPAELARFRIAHLEHLLGLWPYIAVVDAFQHWVYTHPEDGRDPDACDEQWLSLWRRFLPGVDWGGLEDAAMTGWQRKGHIHRSPFYYIEYGLAQLGAVQVWRAALEDPAAALERYRAALALGGCRPLPALYASAGAKFAFDEETLAEAVDFIEQTIADLENTGMFTS